MYNYCERKKLRREKEEEIEYKCMVFKMRKVFKFVFVMIVFYLFLIVTNVWRSSVDIYVL